MEDLGKLVTLPAGRLTGRLSRGPDIVLHAGECAYGYKGLLVTKAAARKEYQFPVGGAPTYTYHLQLDPDFTLRLFNLSDRGRLETEVTYGEWPAKPKVECRTGR